MKKNYECRNIRVVSRGRIFRPCGKYPNLTTQIQKKPSASLYVDRGSAYLQAGDAKQAVARFDRALEQSAVNVDALRLRARAQSKLGRPSSITDLSSAIALAPSDATLYLARAEAYAAAGDARHAYEDREEADRRLDPSVESKTQSRRRITAPAETHLGSVPLTVTFAPKRRTQLAPRTGTSGSHRTHARCAAAPAKPVVASTPKPVAAPAPEDRDACACCRCALRLPTTLPKVYTNADAIS